MHEKIEELEKKIIECTLAKAEECGLENIDTEELGQITDMIKDLAEARFHEVTTKAMEKEQEYNEKMGYDNYRYMSSGRWAPKGRGTYSPGYTPYPYMMDEPREFPGYTEAGDRSSSINERGTRDSARYDGRMGYPMDSGIPGRNYTEYRDRRRAYTENQTAENRKMMEESAQRHLEELVEQAKEMYMDSDQPAKVKMRDTIVKLINEMA